MNNTTALIRDLRTTLFSKIKNEWHEKWALNHGNQFECLSKLPSQNAFFECLVDDIDQELDAHLGVKSVDYFITKHTIRRFLDAEYHGGFNIKTKTAIALYCGYVDWNQFIKEQQHSKQEFIREELQNQGNPAAVKVEETIKARPFTIKITPTVWKVIGGIAFLILTGIFAMNAFSTASQAPMSVDGLFNIVRNANQAELRAYQTLSKEDLKKLHDYFESNSSALRKIDQVVIDSKAKNRTITNNHNPSTFDILDLSLVELKENQALIKSHEYWYMKWFDNTTNDYISYVYKSTNTQYYLLVKQGNTWKIRTNAYPLAEEYVAGK